MLDLFREGCLKELFLVGSHFYRGIRRPELPCVLVPALNAISGRSRLPDYSKKSFERLLEKNIILMYKVSNQTTGEKYDGIGQTNSQI